MKGKLYFFALLVIALCFFSGCKKSPPLIYMQITYDGTGSISSYTDNNNAIPYNFSYNTSYGPCSAGTYTYSFTASSGSHCDNGSYSLFAPSEGNKRYYTLTLHTSGYFCVDINDYDVAY